MQIPPNPFKTNSGYGLALIIVFVISTILIGTSFQLLSAPTVMTYLGSSSQDNLTARQLAITAMDAVEADILSKLNAGDSIDAATYRYPASGTVDITAPQDPGNLSGSSTIIGSYYATLTVARDRAYLAKVIATAGGATINYSKLILADNANSEFDCSIVEGKIFNGEIGKASLTDAELIEWAQNDCMIKTASVTPTAPTVNNGTDACGGSHGGASPIKLAVLGCGSATNVAGTATQVYLQSGTAISTGGSGFYSKLTSGSRTVHIPGNVAANAIISGKDTTLSHTWLFNAANPSSHFTLEGSEGNDDVTFNGDSSGFIKLNGGTNNSIIVTGIYGRSTSNIGIETDAASGALQVYVQRFQSAPGYDANVKHVGSGSANIYFNELAGANIKIETRNNNDIISCGGLSISGSTPSCTPPLAGVYNFIAYDGNDIISLDTSVTKTYINGNNGHDIIYTKGCSTDTVIYANTGPSSGGDLTVRDLVISGGNRYTGCAITGAGSSIILKKSGTTDGGTITGFAKTLTY